MKSRFGTWLGILISLFFLGLLIWSLDWQRVAGYLREATYWWLIPAVGFSLTSFIFRAQRFRLFLRSMRPFSLWKSYAYIAINYMGNNIYPARAGEFLLSYVVKQQDDIPISSSLAVTLLGRVLDALILLSLLLVPLFKSSLPRSVTLIIIIGLVGFGGAFVVLGWLVFGHPAHHAWVRSFLHKLTPEPFQWMVHKLAALVKTFRVGILPLRSWPVAMAAVGLGIIIWTFESGVYWSVGHAFNLHMTVGTIAFLVALTNIVSSVPSGPAAIGTFDAVVTLGLRLHGVNQDHGAAYAFLLHLTQVLPITLVGMLCYASMGIKQAADGQEAPVQGVQ